MIKLLGEKASKNEIDAVVKEADNNGDGTVDFEGEIKGSTNAHTQGKKMFIINISCLIVNLARKGLDIIYILLYIVLK